jgi:hypothetical protein
MKLLCISNGHGEDTIAVKILKELPGNVEVVALPIVGEGKAYREAGIPILGRVQQMPSGGFVYMDGRQFARDVRSGLIGLTWNQITTVRKWNGDILAVGDIVPLAMAYLSGRPYSFVGTAKSEYYIRNENRRLKQWPREVYTPWERWLMKRAKVAFVRDQLTADNLNGLAQYVGNPMMDGLYSDPDDGLTIALLPGSREPEVFENWRRISKAIETIDAKFLVASPVELPGVARTDFVEAIARCHVGIATAGTATEQLVGLGKPVITIPGDGPQFTYEFAEAQSRLLGESIIMVENPEYVATVLHSLLGAENKIKNIKENGLRRMGRPGASKAIANLIFHYQ